MLYREAQHHSRKTRRALSQNPLQGINLSQFVELHASCFTVETGARSDSHQRKSTLRRLAPAASCSCVQQPCAH